MADQLFPDSKEFQNAIQTLKNVQSLTLDGNPSLFTNLNDAAICLENVLRFKTDIDSNSTEEISCSFPKLIKLEMDFSTHLNVAFFNFIDKHREIKYSAPTVNSISATDLSNVA